MTTGAELILQAFREGNIVPAGATLTAGQLSEGLSKLNASIFTLVGDIIGEEPRDWAVPATISAASTPSWNDDPSKRYVQQQPVSCPSVSNDTTYQYPPPNSRLIIRANDQPLTVYFPPAPDDGAQMEIVDLNSTAVVTLDGNGRFINDAATLVMDPVSSFNGKRYMYRADKATWYELADMTVDSESVLPKPFDDMLSIETYFGIASRYGSTPAPATIQRYRTLRKKLQRRYRQRQPNVAPAKGPRNSQQEYTGVFNSGR